ncbi:MAG: elongation factor Ts [Ruminococcaceae bacterium]|nr:elongation factor Ts [Oscillospiraceae bacterium]
MAFTAKDVAELRKQTGCGMMDCKNALVEADGDFEKAIKVLREKGVAASAKKASRIAAEGLVAILSEGGVTAMVEVNSETDFVAKNETFRAFVDGILRTIIANRPADVEALMACKFDGTDDTVEAAFQEKTFTIGEKLSLRRFLIVDGVVSTYVHGAGVTGVIVNFETAAEIAEKAEFKEFAKNIALQVAAMSCQYVDKDSVPASVIEEEKEIILKQMEQDPKMAGKPQKVLDGIVMGKLGKFYEANCLVEQAYVKEDNMKVSAYVAKTAKELGGDIKVVAFYRYDKGEGLQKREDNFGDEIASMLGGKA